MSIVKILETLDRAHTGPVHSVKEWDTRIIPGQSAKRVREHGLQNTFSLENPINSDDALADEFYRAGFEMAVETGLLCVDTERVINVTREELQDALDSMPSEVVVGKGADEVVVRARRPEDPVKPVLEAPLAIVISEDIWISLMTQIAELPEVDLNHGGSLATVFGRQVLSGTPFETLLGRVEAQMNREVLWRAGRSGMCTVAVSSSTTEYGVLGGFGVPGGYDADFDVVVVLSPSELKTSYSSLHKVVHAINCGAKFISGSHSYIGGYAGTPEATAVCAIAAALLQRAVHWCRLASQVTIDDIRYVGSCSRAAQWALGIALQAVSRNTHLPRTAIVTETAGPCTRMLLYEAAMGMMNISVSGTSMSTACRSSGGKYTDYLTPLEIKFCGEVYKACAGMTRKQANEIARVIIPKYEEFLLNPPKGLSVYECYDLENRRPKKEWFDIYMDVKKEMVDLGIPLNL